MSQALESSTGFAPQRVFELPVPNTDREAPRYLTCVGSLVDLQMAANRPWTKFGGIGVTNPCLRYAQMFLRRAWITPLLKDTHDFKPFDYVKKIVDGDPTEHGYFRQVVPPNFTVPFLPPARGGGYGNIPSPTGNMVGRVAYPGEEIGGILTGNTNIHEGAPRGIVELPIKQDYRPRPMGNGLYVDPDIWRIQQAIFPDYPNFFDEQRQPTVLLADLLRIIDNAKVHTLLRPIVDKFGESALQFEAYATITIENSEAKMREIAATAQGYIPRYTPVELVLLEQLGRKRKDRTIQDASKVAGDPELRDMFKQFISLQVEEKIANRAREERMSQVPEREAAVSAQTMMAQPREFGDAGQSGTSGASGASGQVTNATSEGQKPINVAMADVAPWGIAHQINAGPLTDSANGKVLDLNGSRPAHIHHKTWEKMRRNAGLE